MITVIPNATEQNLRIGADDTGDFIRAATQLSAQREANQAALVQQARQRLIELQDRNLAGGYINPQTKRVEKEYKPEELEKSRTLETNWAQGAATNVYNGDYRLRSTPYGPNVVIDPSRVDDAESSAWVQDLSKSPDPADISTYQKLGLQPGYTGAQATEAILKNESDVRDAVRRTGWIGVDDRPGGYAVPGSRLTNIFEKPYGR